MDELLQRLRSASRPGFLFSGGSARTVFQVGVIETLLELGIRPAACLGVSAGAWNAAAVAAGNAPRLRSYWRFFCRMPYVDLRNLFREHSPFIWTRIHRRAFDRYIGGERFRSPDAIPAYVALTRLRDRQPVVMNLCEVDDPFSVLLASNYLPPFYTHSARIAGERYGDGGFTDNAPYEFLLERGCDVIVLMTSKGVSEGGIYRNHVDFDHQIPAAFAGHVIVIRPRHRLSLGFIERRWTRLEPIARLGALRAREVLLGETHAETETGQRGPGPTVVIAAARRKFRQLF